ncbi:unnamed protein product [Gulo gulo]|uniref:Immunoglobulin V-set domain-containing protein n=1 Tax=Gulo gulo TaxID=48420 RepID=A0A9X9PZP2_GULGU|nr:unnamed protein product [Gulo gulo]
MVTPSQLLDLLLLWVPTSHGEIVLTQSPAILSMAPKEGVTITCRTSQNINKWLAWYQQEKERAPKLLLYEASKLETGVPLQFSGSGWDRLHLHHQQPGA